MKKTTTFIAVCMLTVLSSSGAMAADCKLAKEQFDRGLAAGKKKNWHEAKEWLHKSVSNCNRFDNWYLLGQLEQEMKNYDAAIVAFEDARNYAENKNDKAIAIARYAQILSQQGKIYEPLTLLHEVRKMHSKPPAWVTALARDLDIRRAKQPMTVAQLTGGLNNRAVRLLESDKKPSINVTINFKSNSTDVLPESEQNIDVLAKALADQSFADRKITIIGHADIRGEDGYNKELSQKRADRIAKELLRRDPQLSAHLATLGKGESEPLYFGTSEQDHMLNRRIEILVEN